MKLTICTVIALTLGVAAQERQTSYTTVDFPGAVATTIAGFNRDAQIVGFYRDAAGRTH